MPDDTPLLCRVFTFGGGSENKDNGPGSGLSHLFPEGLPEDFLGSQHYLPIICLCVKPLLSIHHSIHNLQRHSPLTPQTQTLLRHKFHHGGLEDYTNG